MRTYREEVAVLHRRLQEAFLSWGWLMITMLPFTQVLGRAIFSIFISVYFLWGVISLYGQQRKIEAHLLGLFVGLLLALLISVPGAENLGRAEHKWFIFVVYSISFIFTVIALRQAEGNLERLCRAFAVGGIGVLIAIYLRLGYILLTDTEFVPTQLREENLPFLLPFFLYGLQRIEKKKYRLAAGGGLVLAVLSYPILSEARTELLAVLVSLVLYGVLVAGWRLRVVLLPSIIAAAGLIAMVSAVHVAPAPTGGEAWTETLDRVSSGRSVLWRQAFVYPPESPITGVGMGNGRYAEQALTLEEGQVRHFHNLFIDAWYETGLFGLIAITAWLIIILVRAWGDWLKSTGEIRRQLGLLLSASFAILVAAQLGPSYGSKLFSLYLFVLFAALTVLHDKAERAASGALSP
jgi:teichuronic acid biosynthesis protein TuaE